MAMVNNDLKKLRKWLSSFKTRHFVIFFSIIIGIYVLNRFVGLQRSDLTGPDYKKVAEKFIMGSAYITQRIGNISNISHIGVGGDSNKESHNAYSIRGEKGLAVCYITLKINEDKLWYVDSSILMYNGTEYNIPVTRTSESRKIKVF